MISCVGAGRNAKRAALVHLSFNVIGSVFCLTVFMAVRAFCSPLFLAEAASLPGIAAAHTVFNVLCVLLMLPVSGLLERLVNRMVPDAAPAKSGGRLFWKRYALNPPNDLPR